MGIPLLLASGGLIDLNGQGHYLSVGWLSISYGNAAVIALMLLTFAAALWLPFPGNRS